MSLLVAVHPEMREWSAKASRKINHSSAYVLHRCTLLCHYGNQCNAMVYYTLTL